MPVWGALVGAIVSAGLGAGLAAASAPDYANPAKSSRRVSLASLRALPGQRMVEQAARLGQRVEYPTGKIVPTYETHAMTREQLEQARSAGQISPRDFATYDRQLRDMEQQPDKFGIHEGGPAPTVDVQIKTGNHPETRVADFTGYGDADVQGQIARAMAGNLLELQQKYGVDFVKEALRQQELADPEGTAARALLADRINQMEADRKTREHPVANALDASVMEDLNQGRAADDAMRDEIARTLARRGDSTLTEGAVADEMARGLQGEERLRERLQKGTSYLSSGVSPTDAAYREEQQSMANMASFLRGQTPQSQFASLSGGQQGATPNMHGPALPGVDPNLQALSQNAGLQSYSAGVRAAANQVSPWFTGLNALVNAGSIAGKAGYKPFSNN